MSIPRRAQQTSLTRYATQRSGFVALAASLGLLLFAPACTSNGTSVPGPYSNSSLNGTYVLQLSGQDAFLQNNNEVDESYTETIVLKADGRGHLTGVDDFNSSVLGFTGGTTFTGNYNIQHDGNGAMTINFSAPSSGQINLSITLSSTKRFVAAEADAFLNFSANATGVGVLQDSTAISSAPAGTFVMRLHEVIPNSVSSATVGALTSPSGAAVTGTIDVLRNDALLPQLTLASGSSFGPPDTNGTGTLTYTDSDGVTSGFKYYIIDANTFWLMTSDNTILGKGTAERQASGALNLAGNFAFGSGGDTDSFLGGVRSVGVFTAAAGSITGGALDSVQDDNPVTDQAFTGTYTQGANGRVSVTLLPTGGAAIPEIFWMVSNSRAYFLVDSTTKVEDGTLDMQTQNTFATTDFKSQYGYAMIMDGYLSTSGYLTRVGTLYPDGNGNMVLNEETNLLAFPPGSLPGTINDPPTLQGSYQVQSNGRVAGIINSLSNNLVIYLISPSQAYLLQNDLGVENSGQLTLQTSP